jgi:GTPase SAR1 family protein
VMGGAAVGKSALTIRFVMKKFVTEVCIGLFFHPNHAPRNS